MQKTFKVKLVLKTNEYVAREAAETVLMRANPHDSNLVATKLEEAGITCDALIKYFEQIGCVVSEFWNAVWDPTFQTTLKNHEVRNLYLPVLYGVIFASVGNMKVGNYEYLIVARNESGKSRIDKKFLFEFSAKLEAYRQYVKGDVGQIGNRSAKPQSPVMLSIIGDATERSAEVWTRDGVQPDSALAGLAALTGLSLVDEAYSILYTGVEEVNFRQMMGTVVQKEPDKF